MKWRSYVLAFHRDLGYFLSGVIVMYAISGITMNHIDIWNPNFIVERKDVQLDLPSNRSQITHELVKMNLVSLGESENFRSLDYPSSEKIKIYLKNGDILASLSDGRGVYEKIRRRPLLYEMNHLHLNPEKWWKLFSDVFAVGLVLLAMTGLLIARGRKGFLGRGKWFVGAGLIIPLAAILMV